MAVPLCSASGRATSWAVTGVAAVAWALLATLARLSLWPARASSAAFAGASAGLRAPTGSSFRPDNVQLRGSATMAEGAPVEEAAPRVEGPEQRPQQIALGTACLAAAAATLAAAAARRSSRVARAAALSPRWKRVGTSAGAPGALAAPAAALAPPALSAKVRQQQQLDFVPGTAPTRSASTSISLKALPEAEMVGQVAAQASLATADPAATAAAIAAGVEAAASLPKGLVELLGPPLPANAAEVPESVSSAWSSVSAFFFDPRLQWDENGNVLLDPRGDPLPDNLWTQFVACQATLIKRLDQGISGLGIPQSFGWAVACYTLGVRTVLYPFVKGQLETAAKIQVLAPRVNELRKKYKDDEELLQQEVGLLYMDLQVDPLGAVFPLLLQLPIFWGLYRGIRRLAIVDYDHLKESWLWIPSLYGPNFQPDPSLNWVTQWQGPLISLHPKMGWTDFGLYAILPVSIAVAYKQVLSEATQDESSPKLLQALPFLLAFITIELPQAMGIYIATNIVSSVALTAYTREQISSKIPGYDEFVKTGEWPEGVDPEKVLAEAFGVKPLTDASRATEDPATVPEAVFSGRVDYIPELLRQGRSIDEYDDKGIPASAYTLALDNTEALERLLELGADPLILDKRGNSLLHYAAGYGRSEFLLCLLERDTIRLLNTANEDGQTPLDVARMNLSQEKVADDVRKIIGILGEKGAEGKTTTEADEARFEEAREQRKKEESLNAARNALKAMAMAAQAREAAAAAAAAHEQPIEASVASTSAEAKDNGTKEEKPSFLAESLDRVKALDVEDIKKRLGGSLSEEQLQKVSERLSKMNPEELAAYAAGLPSVREAAEENGKKEKAPEPKPKPEPVPVAAQSAPKERESVIVD